MEKASCIARKSIKWKTRTDKVVQKLLFSKKWNSSIYSQTICMCWKPCRLTVSIATTENSFAEKPGTGGQTHKPMTTLV